MKILLIGFKPFATHKTNPSETVLKLIKKEGVVPVLLDVSYAKAKEQFLKAVEKEKPDAILGLGLSPFRSTPTFEQYGYNLMDSVQPDEDGVVMTKQEIIPGGQKSYVASYDIASLQTYLSSEGIHSSICLDPGRFVLNEIYYLALASGIKSVFVHLPEEWKFEAEESAEAVEKILEFMNF